LEEKFGHQTIVQTIPAIAVAVQWLRVLRQTWLLIAGAGETQKTEIEKNRTKKRIKVRRINRMERLRYEKYNGLNSMIIIDLHNGYSVVAANGWNKKERNYKVSLFLKDNEVDTLNLIEEAKAVEIRADYKTINSAILRHVSELLESGFFQTYIERAEYEQKCFDIGNMVIEEIKHNPVSESDAKEQDIETTETSAVS
jgi:hypothetical protein